MIEKFFNFHICRYFQTFEQSYFFEYEFLGKKIWKENHTRQYFIKYATPYFFVFTRNKRNKKIYGRIRAFICS